MTEEIEKAYKFAPLAKYSLKERTIIRAADRAFSALIRTIGKTIRYEVEGWENFEAIEKAGKLPIYSFWHNRIFSGTYFFRNRGIVVITSQSKDGEYIARFIQRLGFGAVRGSSTRGGVLSRAFSVDGPKGPRYVAKNGAVLLAKKTGNPLMPFVVENKNYWTVKSWDRLQIPKPFTRVRVIIGKPIYVSPEADIEVSLAELQQSLDRLVTDGENWRTSE